MAMSSRSMRKPAPSRSISAMRPWPSAAITGSRGGMISSRVHSGSMPRPSAMRRRAPSPTRAVRPRRIPTPTSDLPAPGTLGDTGMPRATLRTASALAEAGLVDAGRLPEIERVAAEFAVAITPGLADLIDPADPDDPIGRQFMPDILELVMHPDELRDPIGDEAFSPV